MGNYVSNNAVYLSAKRALMKYNIESRVFKEIEKQGQKPLPAPKHDAGIMDYHKSLKGIYRFIWRNACKTINLFNYNKFIFLKIQQTQNTRRKRL